MDTFLEISLIIVIATVISGIMRVLKQPLIIGYIITGLIVGPYALDILSSPELLETFSEFGIALLLFIVGLHLSPKVIHEVGKVSVIAGLGQVTFTSVIGLLFMLLLGFSFVESVYIAVALTFSSTIIVVKLLYDKGDLEKLYGKIAVGFLIIQDIIAAISFIVVSAFSLASNIPEIIVQLFTKGAFLVLLLFVSYKFILPRITKFFARSQEFLFLFSLAWGMGLASLFNVLGFSMEIGALVAGIILSLFPYNYEISAKMRPLRDFFLILFFILLGSHLALGNVLSLLVPAIVLSVFVLIGNPLIVMGLIGFLGYNKKTGFLSGLTMAQVSEFSLILIALGVGVGHLSNSVLSLVTLVGVITIAVSSYLILYSDKIYPRISKYLSVFEKKTTRPVRTLVENYDAILFGCNRIGYDFLEVFEKEGIKLLVVDFNPDTIKDLMRDNVLCRYGDADDGEFLDELQLSSVKMIVSTLPDFDTNVFLVSKIRKENKNAIIIVVSYNIDNAFALYACGATYVIMPHFLGGEYASGLVSKYKFSRKKFLEERKTHMKDLNKKKFLGHDHPPRRG